VALLCAAAPCQAADVAAETAFRYQAWTSDADEDGYQAYVPAYLRGTLDRFRWEVVAGYAATGAELVGNGERSISGFLDTQLNLAYLLPQTLGLDWLIGVDTNLPTGQTGEDPRDLRVMLDPDLVSIVTPGRGLDFNPFVNVAKRWGGWTFGAGAGWAFQGEYDYSSVDQDYDPGDILNFAAEVLYAWASGWQTRLFGQYALFDTDTLAGQDLLERGDTLLVGVGVRYEQDRYGAGLSLKSISRQKSEYRLDSGAGIGTEPHNGYGDEWLADLDARYRFGKATTVSAVLSYMFVEENEYDERSIYYVGPRTKTALSLGLGHELNDWLRLQATLSGFLMDDDPNWIHPGQERRYEGWSASVGVTTHF
jgi:hypothetical protein